MSDTFESSERQILPTSEPPPAKDDQWWWVDYFPFAALLLLLVTILLAFQYVEGVFQAEIDILRRQVEMLDALLKKGNLERQRLLDERRVLSEAVRELLAIRTRRRQLIEDLERRLASNGFKMEFDADHGILRLPVDGLFPSGQDQVVPDGQRLLSRMARALDSVLPSYLHSTASSTATTPINLESLVIEGHTDDQPVHKGSPFRDNWNLSSARAIKVLSLFLDSAPELARLRNPKGQTLLAIGGHGDQRPVSPNESEAGRQRNRRIELRFIMTSSKAPLIFHPLLEEVLVHSRD